MRHILTTRWIIRGILLALTTALIAFILGGCAAPVPVSTDDVKSIGEEMATIEADTADQLNAYIVKQKGIIDDSAKIEKKTPEQITKTARATFLLAYAYELQQTMRQKDRKPAGSYADAKTQYEETTRLKSELGFQAQYRLGILAANGLLAMPPAESVKYAKDHLKALTSHYDKPLLARGPNRDQEIAGAGGVAIFSADGAAASSGARITQQDMAAYVRQRLDDIYRTGGPPDSWYYDSVAAIIRFSSLISSQHAAVLALLAIALFVKLITLPMTVSAFRGMRDMQRVQPLLKELQEKYADDRQKLAEEQMKLFKEHKVSPLGSCLPTLIQIPIFLIVWNAVSVYSAHFAASGFLWINDLSRPNQILLLLYAASMIITQKLTTVPTTDPQQKQTQQMMTIFMPFMLFFVLQTTPSAFVLYWFFLNVLSSVHQYYLLQKFKKEDALASSKTIEAESIKPSRGKKGNK